MDAETEIQVMRDVVKDGIFGKTVDGVSQKLHTLCC